MLNDLLEEAVVVLDGMLEIVLNDALNSLLLERVAYVVERVLVGYGVEHGVEQNHRVEDELEVVPVAQIVQNLHDVAPWLAILTWQREKDAQSMTNMSR